MPALELADGTVLTQSLAIIEWLEEVYPSPRPAAGGPLGPGARLRASALVVAADTHPLQNLKVLHRAAPPRAGQGCGHGMGGRRQRRGARGLRGPAFATAPGPYCFGASPTLADICLVPQLGNARRFGVDLASFPRLLEREAACMALNAFRDAVPARQPDAEP